MEPITMTLLAVGGITAALAAKKAAKAKKQREAAAVPAMPMVPTAGQEGAAGNDVELVIRSSILLGKGQTPGRSPAPGYEWKTQTILGGVIWKEQLKGLVLGRMVVLPKGKRPSRLDQIDFVWKSMGPTHRNVDSNVRWKIVKRVLLPPPGATGAPFSPAIAKILASPPKVVLPPKVAPWGGSLVRLTEKEAAARIGISLCGTLSVVPSATAATVEGF